MTSYCAACGGALSEGANFCSVCGKAITNPVHSSAAPVRLLVRPKAGRKIAGICQAFSNYYGWDVSLTRVLTVLITIFTFPIGLVAYVLCWLVVPEEPSALPSVTTLNITT